MATSDAFLAHVVSRMQADIDFLVGQGVISSTDGQLMTSKLPSAHPAAGMPTPMASPSPTPTLVVPPARRVAPPAPAPPYSQAAQARSLWPYNETGQEPGDLSFMAGETIEILEETNADWWKGKNSRGQTGLFPSNYVEKVAPTSTGPPVFPGGHMVAPIPSEKASYNPMPLAPVPPPEPQQVQAPKKRFGGKLGGTMAQAAAGGVGFGAGAAVGGGIINAIF